MISKVIVFSLLVKTNWLECLSNRDYTCFLIRHFYLGLFAPDIDRKAKKKIHKSTKFEAYLAAVAEALK